MMGSKLKGCQHSANFEEFRWFSKLGTYSGPLTKRESDEVENRCALIKRNVDCTSMPEIFSDDGMFVLNCVSAKKILFKPVNHKGKPLKLFRATLFSFSDGKWSPFGQSNSKFNNDVIEFASASRTDGERITVSNENGHPVTLVWRQVGQVELIKNWRDGWLDFVRQKEIRLKHGFCDHMASADRIKSVVMVVRGLSKKLETDVRKMNSILAKITGKDYPRTDGTVFVAVNYMRTIDLQKMPGFKKAKSVREEAKSLVAYALSESGRAQLHQAVIDEMNLIASRYKVPVKFFVFCHSLGSLICCDVLTQRSKDLTFKIEGLLMCGSNLALRMVTMAEAERNTLIRSLQKKTEVINVIEYRDPLAFKLDPLFFGEHSKPKDLEVVATGEDSQDTEDSEELPEEPLKIVKVAESVDDGEDAIVKKGAQVVIGPKAVHMIPDAKGEVQDAKIPQAAIDNPNAIVPAPLEDTSVTAIEDDIVPMDVVTSTTKIELRANNAYWSNKTLVKFVNRLCKGKKFSAM